MRAQEGEPRVGLSILAFASPSLVATCRVKRASSAASGIGACRKPAFSRFVLAPLARISGFRGSTALSEIGLGIVAQLVIGHHALASRFRRLVLAKNPHVLTIRAIPCHRTGSCDPQPEFVSLTYVWIGIGSAIGGIGRYWLSTVMTAVTGPGFPWGTILINVLGSFVIGFFGTLTGPNGALAVHSDARAFVMVGICGGFTTFSSFSLQTFDLAKGGDWFQPAMNVVLSLVLCLLAVSGGVLAASSINGAFSDVRG